jgi:hypothetical protein
LQRHIFVNQLKTNSKKIKYVSVKGGEAQAQHPCYSGFHMFNGAAEEAYSAIDSFISEIGINK